MVGGRARGSNNKDSFLMAGRGLDKHQEVQTLSLLLFPLLITVSLLLFESARELPWLVESMSMIDTTSGKYFLAVNGLTYFF